MKTFRLIFFLILAFSIASGIHAEGRRLALLIGVGDYPATSGLKKLSADSDTDRLADALKSNGWQVTVLNCNQYYSTYLPTQANMLRSLGIEWNSITNMINLVETSDRFIGYYNLDPDDVVLFYYGGHGITDERGMDCLMPQDISMRGDKVVNAKHLIPLEWVKEALVNTKAGMILMFTDACREMVATRRFGEPTTPRWTGRTAIADEPPIAEEYERNPEQSIFMLKSAGRREVALEMQQTGEGVFTHFMIQLLTNDAAKEEANGNRRDGIITIADLTNYLIKNTKDFVEQLPATHKSGNQIPSRYWEGPTREDFVFLEFYSRIPIRNIIEALGPCISGMSNDFRDLRLSRSITYDNGTEKWSTNAFGFEVEGMLIKPEWLLSLGNGNWLLNYKADCEKRFFSNNIFSRSISVLLKRYFPGIIWKATNEDKFPLPGTSISLKNFYLGYTNNGVIVVTDDSDFAINFIPIKYKKSFGPIYDIYEITTIEDALRLAIESMSFNFRDLTIGRQISNEIYSTNAHCFILKNYLFEPSLLLTLNGVKVLSYKAIIFDEAEKNEILNSCYALLKKNFPYYRWEWSRERPGFLGYTAFGTIVIDYFLNNTLAFNFTNITER